MTNNIQIKDLGKGDKIKVKNMKCWLEVIENYPPNENYVILRGPKYGYYELSENSKNFENYGFKSNKDMVLLSKPDSGSWSYKWEGNTLKARRNNTYEETIQL